MPANDSVEFTPRELYLINYYRATSLSSNRASAWVDSGIAVVSLGLVGVWALTDSIWAGCLGYAVLLYRYLMFAWASRQYTGDFRSIFGKYEAKLHELAHARATPAPPPAS